MMRANMARSPPDRRARNAATLAGGPALGQVGGHDRHDGDGDDAIGHLEEGVGVGIGGDRVGATGGAGEKDDHELGHLVGQHEAERPSAEADHCAQRGIVEVPVPAEPPRVPPRAGSAPERSIAGPPRARCRARAARCRCGRSRGVARLGAASRQDAEPDEDTDADEVVDDRRPGDGHEAPLRVEQRGGQGEDAVGGDLDHEPAQQRRGVGALGRDGVDEVGVR